MKETKRGRRGKKNKKKICIETIGKRKGKSVHTCMLVVWSSPEKKKKGSDSVIFF